MSVEATLSGHIADHLTAKSEEKAVKHRKISPFEYPKCNGHPASSPYNWVLTDYLCYHFAKLLHVADDDLKKRTNMDRIDTP